MLSTLVLPEYPEEIAPSSPSWFVSLFTIMCAHRGIQAYATYKGIF